jgi:hypothetical protein
MSSRRPLRSPRSGPIGLALLSWSGHETVMLAHAIPPEVLVLEQFDLPLTARL